MAKKTIERPEKCPKCGGSIIAVEYGYGSQERYDGISEYACVNRKPCGWRIGRWSGQEIPEGHVESRYGTRGVVPVSKYTERPKR